MAPMKTWARVTAGLVVAAAVAVACGDDESGSGSAATGSDGGAESGVVAPGPTGTTSGTLPPLDAGPETSRPTEDGAAPDADAASNPDAGTGDLLVTEVSNCHFGNDACWFEVMNASSAPIDLAAYVVRTGAVNRDTPTTLTPSQSFSIPSLVVAPGDYAVVRGRVSADIIDGPQHVSLLAGGNLVPHWGNGSGTATGYVELLKGGKTVDFVRFGDSTVTPTTGSWNGASVVGWPSGDQTYTHGIARTPGLGDTDRASDWVERAFPTPGGPNDVTDATDADNDGIPDQAEVAGGKLGGLDLYAMGARTGKKDVFLEIDWMKSSDPGVVPQRAALDAVVAAFALHGITMHFDTGPRFAATFDPASYNLGGGGEVPFAEFISLGDLAGSANTFSYKAASFDIRRQFVFHYLVMGNKAKDGSAGLGELHGNDLVITMGGLFVGLANANPVNNNQAAALMHELGHNLGLHHGGSDEVNFKPNYISAMNYLYAQYGLPIIGTQEGDRYYLRRHQTTGATCGGIATENDLIRSRSGTQFVLDYSNGSSAPLDENALDEAAGLGRSGSVAVDYDCSGAIGGAVSVDVNGDSTKTTLTDFDDWGHLDLAFGRHPAIVNAGSSPSSLDPLGNDRQPVARETR